MYFCLSTKHFSWNLSLFRFDRDAIVFDASEGDDALSRISGRFDPELAKITPVALEYGGV